MTELPVEARAVVAMARFVFPREAIRHARLRAGDIARGDTEVEELLLLWFSLLDAGR